MAIEPETNKAQPANEPDSSDALFKTGFHSTIAYSPGSETVVGDDQLIGSLLDHYWIRHLLGRGGMGQVYLAWHDRLHRLCAVKVIPPAAIDADPRRLEMFFSEARAAAKLHHPNIVSVHSLGHSRGYHFIEMEFVEGRSLRRMIEKEGGLAPYQATKFASQIASAVAAAHGRDIIHCDVKPDNVMVSPSDVAKLADFGLARAAAYQRHRAVVGTPPYMAPEVFLGKGASSASDVYALGATYFTLLTGRVPYIGNSMAEMEMYHVTAEVPKVSEHREDVPEDVCRLIQEMMAKDPRDRPDCDNELVGRIESIASRLIPLKDLVRQAVQSLDVEVTGDGEEFEFDIRLTGGRHQIIRAEVIDAADKSGQLLSFWTPCAPATSTNFDYVLRLNGRLPFGAISIREYQGQPYFIMVENHARAHVGAEQIRTAIVHMSVWADMIEHHFTGKDVH